MDTKIINEFRVFIEQDSRVHAMWIAGSVAEGYNDELSDVDIWLDIEDKKDIEVFATIETFLASKDTLDINFGDNNNAAF